MHRHPDFIFVPKLKKCLKSLRKYQLFPWRLYFKRLIWYYVNYEIKINFIISPDFIYFLHATKVWLKLDQNLITVNIFYCFVYLHTIFNLAHWIWKKPRFYTLDKNIKNRLTCRQFAPVKAPWDVRVHCKPSVFRIVIRIFRQIKTISFVDYAFEWSGTKAYLYKNTTHLLNGVSRRSKKVYSNGISSTFKF